MNLGFGFGFGRSAARGWSLAGYGIDMDFAGNRIFGASTFASAITLTRAATAYAQDLLGNWVAFASNVLRITDQGLLIEEARTQSIRNSRMSGAVVGVIGSGGALPTNWSISNGTGLTKTVVAIGTLLGIDYIDIRINGTTGDGNGTAINFDTSTGIPATSGQAWNTSAFLALVAGNFTNVGNIFLAHSQRNGAGSILSDLNGSNIKASIPASTVTVARLNNQQTLADASTAFDQPRLSIQANNGVAVDYTVRIGWPQAEQGGFMTSPIPSTAGSVLRPAENAFLNNPTNYVSFTEGAKYVEWLEAFGGASGATRYLSSITTASNSVNSRVSTIGRSLLEVISGGFTQAQMIATSAPTVGQVCKQAGRWKLDDVAVRTTAGLGGNSNDTSAAMPVGTPQVAIGSTGSANYANMYIRRLAYSMVTANDNTLDAQVA